MKTAITTDFIGSWIRHRICILIFCMIIVEASKVKGDIAGGAAKLIKGAQPRQATATTLNKGFGKVGTGGYINSPVDEEHETSNPPVIRLANGHISAETLEEIERLQQTHPSEEDYFNEELEDSIIREELAYYKFTRDLATEDVKMLQQHRADAERFMKKTGKSLGDAKEDAMRLKDRHRKRFVFNNPHIRWDKCIIPYEWSNGFVRQQEVKWAMEKIEKYSGIRFVEYNASVPVIHGLSHNNRLSFVDYGGCWSFVGNVLPDGQSISCCNGTSCIHELGHAIGFLHEHTSPLRDDYIRVNYDNINNRRWHNFKRMDQLFSLTFGYYDHSSVMHYLVHMFSDNYKPTLTSLDPDLLHLISRDPRRYYFLDEIEQFYGCMDQFCPLNKPVCENAGFPSVVNGRCDCICPLGLDPVFLCKNLINPECGGIYELNSNKHIQVINSPLDNGTNTYPHDKECVYFLKSPEGTAMQLDFDYFDVDCTDYVEIRNNLPGQPGVKFCGNGFDSSIDSHLNYLAFTFKSDQTDSGGGFQATVRLITDETRCYTHQGKDYSYSGKVNYTESQMTCLKWNEVPKCRFNRFTHGELDDDLDENYCRNTGIGTAPWCYTTADTCAREYCDACGNNKCYDLWGDCSELITADSQFCDRNEDGEAHRGCRKSCNKCIESMPGAATIICLPPNEIEFALGPRPLKSNYTLGEQVTYKCLSSNDTRNRTCTSDGSWTPLNFVCGACPRGWAHIDGKCFLWVDEAMTYEKAVDKCQALKTGATLAMPKTRTQLDQALQLIEIDMEITIAWTGLKQDGPGSTEYRWADNTSLVWSKWSIYATYTDACVCIFIDGAWIDYPCKQSISLICEYQPGLQLPCADQIRNCDDQIRATPTLCVNKTEFARANCRLSCGLCKANVGRLPRDTKTSSISQESTNPSNYCPRPRIPDNTILTTGRNVPAIAIGQIYEYKCKYGFSLLEGDLTRACLTTGELTGQSPTCKESENVPEPVNRVDIRRRPRIPLSGYAYFGMNKDLTITKAGKLSMWRLYSNFGGKVVLQVLRPYSRELQTGNRFTLVGQNGVEDTQTDRIRTIRIDEDKQINVRRGDLLGVFFPVNNYGHIPYTYCNKTNDPEHGMQFRSLKQTPSDNYVWKIGKIYRFTTLSARFEDCKIWSLNAYI